MESFCAMNKLIYLKNHKSLPKYLMCLLGEIIAYKPDNNDFHILTKKNLKGSEF